MKIKIYSMPKHFTKKKDFAMSENKKNKDGSPLFYRFKINGDVSICEINLEDGEWIKVRGSYFLPPELKGKAWPQYFCKIGVVNNEVIATDYDGKKINWPNFARKEEPFKPEMKPILNDNGEEVF